MKVTLLTESEIRECVDIDDEVIDAIEEGFSRLAQGDVAMPPVMRVDIPENNGELDVKSAYIRGLDSFAVKMSSGFFDNHKLGLPSLSGMMVLLSAKTGVPEALLLDNGYLTDVRTGAAGAVAARWLAREKIETVGVIGAGSQGHYQVQALTRVRDFNRVFVYDLSTELVENYKTEMESALGVEVIPGESAETVVRHSDVVITATPAKKPYLKAEWLHPGMHITAMGADAEGKQELFADAVARADRLVCDRKSQSLRLGELHHAWEAGLISEESDVSELGEITSGQKAGRRSDDEITICDLTGTGMQDTVIAIIAYRKAVEGGFGLSVEN